MASTAKSLADLLKLVNQVTQTAKAQLAENATENQRRQRKRATEIAEKALVQLATKLKALEDEHNGRLMKIRTEARSKLLALAESVPTLPSLPEEFGEPVMQPAMDDMAGALDDAAAVAKELEADTSGATLGGDADAAIAAALADAQAAVRDRAVGILEAQTEQLAGGVAMMVKATRSVLEPARAGMDEDDD